MGEKIGRVKFEPHSGYGHKAPDGEPWPFGYISVERPTAPIFELSVILGFPKKELNALARKMAAAPQSIDALAMFVERIESAGNWDDGCFYYNGTAASELQEPLALAKTILAALNGDAK